MQKLFKKFNLGSISKKLNELNPEISFSLHRDFPKKKLLSRYEFRKRFVKVNSQGGIEGGMCRMIISLIDFSFIRSMVAHRYSTKGPPCYDPPSIFLLDLFRYIDNYKEMSRFWEVLHDKNRGRAYRTYAGISDQNIPCQATFSNFRADLGADLYNKVFHVIVDIFHQLEMISFNILAHDGTLYPTWSRYKGCTHFDDKCRSMTADGMIGKIRSRVLYRLNHMDEHPLGSEIRVKIQCPAKCFPEDVEIPKVEVFVCKLAFSDGAPTEEQQNTAILLDLEKELGKRGLCIDTIRSNLVLINPDTDQLTFKCPKIPTDQDAKIGVRRDPKNSAKKQYIFGYNLVLTTSVELHLKLELPVALTNIAGNSDEGKQIITNHKQILDQHECQPKVDLADAKYDSAKNYEYLRSTGSIPIIDYNRRNENLSPEKLKERGYDQNGWPFAPCGILCRPNGYEKKHHRLSFCCFKQCKKLKATPLKNLMERYDIAQCPHIENSNGFATHKSIDENPRLHNEIPRGSKRYNEVKKSRSASERSNSTLKEDLKILEKPRILNQERADILAQIASIVLLLTRAFGFVVRVTTLMRKPKHIRDQKLKFPKIPKNVLNLIQLE